MNYILNSYMKLSKGGNRRSISTDLQQINADGRCTTGMEDALIVPLFKKGHRIDPGNYRPVSLTSVVCKVMERIVKDNVVEHLNEYNVIKGSQHGFTTGRSCLTNLKCFEEVYEKIDEWKLVDVIYLDFANAFDKVPHKRLAKKLQACGIRGQALTWIQRWLSCGRQKVRIG